MNLRRVFLSLSLTFFVSLLLSCGGGGGGGGEPSGSGSTPIVTTLAATSITPTSNILNGTVNPNGLQTQSWFEYGTDATLTTYTSSLNLDAGNGLTSQAVNITLPGLTVSTTYYFRICAENSKGYSKGLIISFTTSSPGTPPTVDTLSATSIGATGATVNGNVTPNGLATTAWFAWGTDPSLLLSTTPVQSVGSGTTSQVVSANLTGLSGGTTYYYMVLANNSSGTTRGTIVSFAQTNGWAPVNTGMLNSSGQSAWINSIVIDPTNSQVVYAGGEGVFKTTNGGSTWSAFNNGVSSINILAIDPINTQVVYAGTYSGVFKTTNGGMLWNSVNTGVDICEITSLAIDPSDTQVVYAGCSNYLGVIKTTDGGSNWSVASTGLTSRDSAGNTILQPDGVNSLVIDPTNSQVIYDGTVGSGVFKTTNGGLNWSAVNNGIGYYINTLAIDPTNTQGVYAGTNGGGVFKTINGGLSWGPVNTGLLYPAVYSLAIDPTNSQVVYAAGYSNSGCGVFKTANGGSSWSPVNSGLIDAYNSIPNITSLAIDPTNNQVVYAGASNYGGVFKTTTGGL